jgi:murein DD-endopeptidase MepM/ murein hydrolase activator NlpD
MALISDLIRKSSSFLSGINSSLNQTKKSTSAVNNSVNNISRIISNSSRTRQNLYVKSDLLRTRRREASRRKEIEDALESRKVSFNSTRGLAFASRSQGSPLARLIGFLGFITSGWIIENLPTWIFMGKEFVNRVYTVSGSMNSMMSNMQLLMNFFGSTLKNSFDAIVRLDFNEFSEGNVAESFQGMISTIEKLGDNFNDIFSIFRTPLTESMTTGEQAPGLGETQPETLFPTVQQEGGGRVTGIHKQALDIISGPESEGDYNAMNNGNAGDRPGGSKKWLGKNLTDMTIAEVMYFQNTSKKLWAAGRYQIIPSTLKIAVQEANLKSSDMFNEVNQDKLGLAVLRMQGIRAWTVGGSRYTASERAIVEKARNTPVTYETTPTQITQQQQQPSTNLSGYKVTRDGANITSLSQLPPHHTTTRTPDKRLRQDFTLFKGNQFVDVPVPSPVSGIVNFAGYSGNGGNWVEIQSPEGLVEMGHFNSLKVSAGDRVSIGSILGLQGYSGRVVPAGREGTHVHIQARDSVISRYISMLSSGKFPSQNTPKDRLVPNKPKQQPSIPTQTTQKPIVNLPQPNISQIIPQRQGSEIILIDAPQPVPQPQYVPSSSQIILPTTIDEYKLLNNFMKNKLLLDLAYL